MLGDVTSVALGPDGTVWALHRAGRVWNMDTFTDDQVIVDTTPIAADVVLQMHPDTGTPRNLF